MKAWSIQPQAVVDKLKAGLPVVGEPDFEGYEYHKTAYDWLVQQMHKRIGPLVLQDKNDLSRGTLLCYPMWFWVPTPKRSLFDLLEGHEETKDEYLLELEIPNHLVVLSDYHLWHHPLNNWNLELFEDEVVNKEESWERVFALDGQGMLTLQSKDRQWMGLDDPSYVQGTTWAFLPDMVVSVSEFTPELIAARQDFWRTSYGSKLGDYHVVQEVE